MTQKVARRRIYFQPEQIFQLQGSDHYTDAGGETDCDRIGHQFNEAPEATKPHRQQHDTRHCRGEEQTTESKLLGNRQQYYDKSGGRPGDIDPRTTAQRDYRTCDYHCI